MSIDLDSTEGRKQYLSEKLDDLLEGINDSYGTLLMEEKERQQLMEMLKTTDGLHAPASGGAPEEQDVSQSIETPFVETEELGEDVPEWEKKLAKLEKK